ncbi:MAG: hypothetical protein Q9M89_08685 [Persephonella sp.]|nr:hypothetical protein [Persephonella sp.]
MINLLWTEAMEIKYPEYLKKVQTYQPGKPISELQRTLGLKEVIKLASNENPFGCSLSVKRVVETRNQR